MRVLLVDPSLYTPPYDGALAEALSARGHEVVLAGRAPRASDPPLGGHVQLAAIFYRHGERWRERERGGIARLVKGVEHVRGLVALRALALRFAPDVVHWQWPSLPMLDSWALRRMGSSVPQIVTVHDRRVFKAKSGLRRVQAIGWTRFLSGADALIAHVPSTRDALNATVSPLPPIGIVPHPVFARAGSTAAEPSGERLRLTFFGRLSDDKGIDVLANALDALAPDVRARLAVRVHGRPIGEDARVARALALLRRLDCVDLCTEYVAEHVLDALLADTDIVVLPHREVDASGMLMKALGHDVGLLASDVPAFREVLGGSAAVRFFRSEDGGALARAIAALVQDPRLVGRMRAAAAALRTGALSWAHAAECTERVYERAIAARRLRASVAAASRATGREGA